MEGLLSERVHKLLETNFKGCVVTSKANVYNSIPKVIPMCDVKESDEFVNLDFGSINCRFMFQWQKTPDGKRHKLEQIHIKDEVNRILTK